jgi:hypothetical protein
VDNLKNRETVNLCPHFIQEAAATGDDGFIRIGGGTRLRRSFLEHWDFRYDSTVSVLPKGLYYRLNCITHSRSDE